MVSQGSTEDHQGVEIEEFISAGPGRRAISAEVKGGSRQREQGSDLGALAFIRAPG